MIRHDRSFPETVADRIVEIQDCALANYEGGWEYYERKMREAGEPLMTLNSSTSPALDACPAG